MMGSGEMIAPPAPIWWSLPSETVEALKKMEVPQLYHGEIWKKGALVMYQLSACVVGRSIGFCVSQ